MSLTETVKLNQEQQATVDAFRNGHSFFLTGQAGTGKSAVLSELVQVANELGRSVGLTAMTGAAALLIGGKTLHSFLGIGLAVEPAADIARRIRVMKSVNQRWKNLDVLIIDEVSMMTGELLEKLDYIAKFIRCDSRPMGGIQTVLSGDFFQLPPVQPGTSTTHFAFQSKVWDQVVPTVFELTKIMRQSDPAFQKCLSTVRTGSCPEDVKQLLLSRVGLQAGKQGDDGQQITTIEPTRLYTRNADTDKINDTRLRELNLPLQEYTAKFSVSTNAKPSQQKVVDKLKTFLTKSAPCHDVLRLCEGAQVMLTHNLDFEAGLVNGSRGVITRFESGLRLPVVQFVNGVETIIDRHAWTTKDDSSKITVAKTQLPLKLAYCLTTHKSQGMSLDLVEIDIGRSVFEAGQAYVALSRVRTLQGLFILDFAPEKIRAHPKVSDFYNRINKHSGNLRSTT